MDELVGEVLSRVLSRSHLLRPGVAAEIIAEEARPLGVQDATIYLADLEQEHLRPMPRTDGRLVPALRIDSTLAGRSYRAIEIQSGPGDDDGLHHAWLPLMDGSERLGVVELVVDDLNETVLDWCRALASLAGLLIVSKSHYSDTHAQVRRS